MLSNEELEYFYHIADEIITDELYLFQKQYIQHSNISVYDHEIHTAMLCFEYALRKNIRCDYRALIRGALLHDFFLYDWHRNEEKRKGLHGYTHPLIAAKNAAKRFSLTSKEISIIRTHMWPLTLFHIPTCREGRILTLMDKKETLLEMRKKAKQA